MKTFQIIATLFCSILLANSQPLTITTLDIGNMPSDKTSASAKSKNIATILPNIAPTLILLNGNQTTEQATTTANEITKHYNEQYWLINTELQSTPITTYAIIKANTAWKPDRRARQNPILATSTPNHLIVTVNTTNSPRIKVRICSVNLDTNETTKLQQEKAILNWAKSVSTLNTNENIIIAGNFQENELPISLNQTIEIMLDKTPQLSDIFSLGTNQDQKTTESKSPDRILINDKILSGINQLQAQGFIINKHNHANDKLFTAHFPVTLFLDTVDNTKQKEEPTQ